MNWTTIRLELASIPSCPQGSASRAYLLRVPLDEHGLIDREAFEENPRQASVRRFWASEPDQYGQLERADGEWKFRTPSRNGAAAVFRFGPTPFLIGGQIEIEDDEGASLPFRVASIRSLGTFMASRS